MNEAIGNISFYDPQNENANFLLESLLANLRWADLRLKTTSLDARCVIEEALLAAHAGKTLATTALPA